MDSKKKPRPKPAKAPKPREETQLDRVERKLDELLSRPPVVIRQAPSQLVAPDWDDNRVHYPFPPVNEPSRTAPFPTDWSGLPIVYCSVARGAGVAHV